LDEETFGQVIKLVLPLLTTTEDAHLMFYDFVSKKRDIVEKYPTDILSLLFAVLPERVAKWPYGANEALDLVVAMEPALRRDAKYIELKRRWDAR
jgi:hypothetical protein